MINRLKEQFVIPVIRETNEEKLYSLGKALAQGGLSILEITLMSDSALKVIKRLSNEDGIILGAGTVLNQEMAKKALDAGARFLVSPGIDREAIEFAQSKNALFIPGTMTPTEIMAAKRLGCELIKIFPISSIGGASFIKNIKGPFPDLLTMVSGGVKLSEISSYMEAGVSCIGAGGELTPKDEIANGDWKTITKTALEVVAEIKKLRS